MLDALVKCVDVDQLQGFILNELARRSLTPAAQKDALQAETPARQAALTHVYQNCAAAGYTGGAPAAALPTADEAAGCIAYMKQLYQQVLKA